MASKQLHCELVWGEWIRTINHKSLLIWDQIWDYQIILEIKRLREFQDYHKIMGLFLDYWEIIFAKLKGLFLRL